MPLQVNEIFYSIQGESLYAGRPCVFIRLTGCNLRCRYCDTVYAYDDGAFFSVPEILEQVGRYSCRLVEVTGGEPLAQADTPALVAGLLGAGYQVLMETNGSMDISRVDGRCVKIMDIKCPSSGESGRNDLENMDRLAPADQVKFVIGDREDFDFARNLLPNVPSTLPPDHVLFSPAHDTVPPRVLADWILDEKLSARLHLQLHKVIWPDVDRGV